MPFCYRGLVLLEGFEPSKDAGPEPTAYAILLQELSRSGGTRTLTSQRTLEPESSAATNYATLPWCTRRDLNPHDLAATAPSRLRVYQFHHGCMIYSVVKALYCLVDLVGIEPTVPEGVAFTARWTTIVRQILGGPGGNRTPYAQRVLVYSQVQPTTICLRPERTGINRSGQAVYRWPRSRAPSTNNREPGSSTEKRTNVCMTTTIAWRPDAVKRIR